MRKLVLIGIACLVAALLVLGCGKSERTIFVPGGKAKVTTEKSGGTEKKTIEIKGKEGTATIEVDTKKKITEAELGIPVYPGSEVVSSGKYETQTKTEAGSVEHHILSTTDDLDKVVAFYKSKLKGVKNTFSMDQGKQKFTMFELGDDKEGLSVQIISDIKDGKTKTMINVTRMRK